MARYYTTCLMVPRVDSRWYALEATAPQGFLFHDTEIPLVPEMLRKALFKLSSLYEDSTHEVLWVRVDKQTIVATFSLAATPRPFTLHTKGWHKPQHEWLQTETVPGGFFTDVHDTTSEILSFDFNGKYDHCIQMERYMGVCPCDKRDTTCLADNLVPLLPPRFSREGCLTSANGTVETKILKRKEYKVLDNFEFITPGHTTDIDFSAGDRGWDDHDFSVVTERKEEFKQRGAAQSAHAKHTNSVCKDCAYSTVSYRSKRLQDCRDYGWRSCAGAVTEEDLRELMLAAYRKSRLCKLPFFTNKQRDFLIGYTRVVRTICGDDNRETVRKIDARFSGFQNACNYQHLSVPGDTLSTWQAVFSAVNGNRTRRAYYTSWSAVVADMPVVAKDFEDFAQLVEPLSEEVLAAYAIVASSTTRNVPSIGRCSEAYLTRISVTLTGIHASFSIQGGVKFSEYYAFDRIRDLLELDRTPVAVCALVRNFKAYT